MKYQQITKILAFSRDALTHLSRMIYCNPSLSDIPTAPGGLECAPPATCDAAIPRQEHHFRCSRSLGFSHLGTFLRERGRGPFFFFLFLNDLHEKEVADVGLGGLPAQRG